MFQKVVKITRHFCQKLRENITPGNWLKIPEIMEFSSLETGNHVNIFVKKYNFQSFNVGQRFLVDSFKGFVDNFSHQRLDFNFY